MSRPRTSASGSSCVGNAEPRVILTSSAVRSPSIRPCSFFIQATIAASRSSPAVRIERLVTTPPREMTATSVVPPPTSTTMLPGGLVDRESGADRGRHRLLDDVDLAGAGLVAGLLDRALLHGGDAAGHADDHARLGEVAPAVHLLDEVPQHLLGRLEVGDHAVLHRPDGGDVVRRTADHPLGLVADGEDLAGGVVERDHARLVEQDPAAADVDQRVGGPEVDGHVTADDAVRHCGCLAGVSGEGMGHTAAPHGPALRTTGLSAG